jgi:hypothetical protein
LAKALMAKGSGTDQSGAGGNNFAVTARDFPLLRATLPLIVAPCGDDMTACTAASSWAA